MYLLDKKTKFLQDEINFWGALIYPHLGNLRRLGTEGLQDYRLGLPGDDDDLSAEFALESFLATVSRYQEVVSTSRRFWPSVQERSYQDGYEIHGFPAEVLAFLGEMSRSSSQVDFAVRLVEKRIEGLDEALSDNSLLDPRDLLSAAFRWRRALAKENLLGVGVLRVSELLLDSQSIGSKLVAAQSRLSGRDLKLTRKALRHYLASEYLFPWLGQGTNEQAYSSLFQMAKLNGETMDYHLEELIGEMLEGGKIAEGHIQQVSRMLGRLSQGLFQIDSFEELIAQITCNGGQWGGDSMVASQEPVNIIPADGKPGSCREVLLAFAQGKGRTRSGLRAVLRQVREHLIQCDKTKIVIILTDTWDPKVIVESAGDFAAYRNAAQPRTIIAALVNGNKLTPMEI